MRELTTHDDAVALVDGEKFFFVGRESDLTSDLRGQVSGELDGEGGTMLPGFVDSHTHLPFAGLREAEFNRRLKGETYSDIARSGGGIASTVRSTRIASEQQLTGLVVDRTRIMARYGTTTAEAKSGYGLNLEDEVKQLRAIRAAADHAPVRLISTCLAAHDFPPETVGDEPARRRYVDQVVEEILPLVGREKLAEYCDVFVEGGVFTIEDGRRILEAGRRAGMIPRIHADELSDTGGALLAAELGCASADHLMFISDQGVRALAASGTVANLLPATSFFLMSERYAPARALIDSGGIVSLSTDCNPGSSMTESMQMVIQLAVLRMKMTVEEALTAATLHGAHSLGLAARTGTIEAGKQADFMILDAPGYLHLVYHFGVNLVKCVYRAGKRVH